DGTAAFDIFLRSHPLSAMLGRLRPFCPQLPYEVLSIGPAIQCRKPTDQTPPARPSAELLQRSQQSSRDSRSPGGRIAFAVSYQGGRQPIGFADESHQSRMGGCMLEGDGSAEVGTTFGSSITNVAP